MGYAEKRGTGDSAYWRGRYSDGHGRYPAVTHPDGSVVKFATRAEAKRAATAEETGEAAARRQAAAGQAAGRMTFGTYARAWYAALDLDQDTLITYGSILRNHLLRVFEYSWLDEITPEMVAGFDAEQRAAGYEERGIRNRRNLLAEILADAAADPAVTLDRNAAARRRGRGRRSEPLPAGDDDEDDDEGSGEHGTVICDPPGALLIAERCAIMTGRDDEFIAVILAYWTGLRWGELAGLETRFVQPGKVRVRWQLRRDVVRKRPKFGRCRDIDIPAWLHALLAAHIERTGPQPCPCHGRTYVFSGPGRARRTRQAVTLADVAAKAGVSQATVSAARHRPATVAEATRARIEAAAEAAGYGTQAVTRPPHWYRSGFGRWVWAPAVSGWYPERAPDPARPVPVAAGPWPGVPVRGKGSARRADACWVPLAAGMTPHGLRHGHKSWMEEARVHGVMSHDRLGHDMPGIAGIYSHPTPAMRAGLIEAMTAAWERSLDQRLALCPSSPVAVLDGLLRERARFSPRILPDDLRQGDPGTSAGL